MNDDAVDKGEEQSARTERFNVRDALQGIRAGGNRSGSVFRLIGTSAAAPQLARWISSPPLPVPTDIPTTPSETARRGQGNLKPP